MRKRLKNKIILYSILFICVCVLLYKLFHRRNSYNVEVFSEKKVHHFHSRFHYGDNILNLKFFYNISDKLKENNIIIHYYYDNNQNKNKVEFQRYVDPDTLVLKSLDEKPDESVELWMGMDIDGISHTYFDEYFIKFYSRILKVLGLEEIGINTSLYQKEDYLFDIYKNLDDKYKNLDILIINSSPHSGQFANYNIESINRMCTKLASKYKVCTTTCTDDSLTCTMRDGLTIQDIGAISIHAKYIVAVFSGPITACFNEYSKDNVKKWIILNNMQYTLKFMYINNTVTDNIESVYDIIEQSQ